jgi:glycosyltransferase involved in cell wall biosynthesis
MVAGLIGELGETSSHYFCLDEYSEYDRAYRCIPAMEAKLLESIDAFYALSAPLLESRKARSGENHFFPMGVDTSLFSLDSNAPSPPEFARLRRPIVGFFGQIGSYVDIELIVQCAKHYPDASFVVIGRPHVDISRFAQAKNIFFVGEVGYKSVPSYAHAFDVAINPRVVNKLSLAMNPLKILEYLSLGLPVVSTDLPAVRTFEDVVSIAVSRDHFIELVGTAMKDHDPEKRKARRRTAEQYSWESVTSRVASIIDKIDSVA